MKNLTLISFLIFLFVAKANAQPAWTEVKLDANFSVSLPVAPTLIPQPAGSTTNVYFCQSGNSYYTVIWGPNDAGTITTPEELHRFYWNAVQAAWAKITDVVLIDTATKKMGNLTSFYASFKGTAENGKPYKWALNIVVADGRAYAFKAQYDPSDKDAVSEKQEFMGSIKMQAWLKSDEQFTTPGK